MPYERFGGKNWQGEVMIFLYKFVDNASLLVLLFPYKTIALSSCISLKSASTSLIVLGKGCQIDAAYAVFNSSVGAPGVDPTKSWPTGWGSHD